MSILQDTFMALKNDKVLCSHLADDYRSIYHQVSPKAAKYPIIVFSIINDRPELFGDNMELMSTATVRIHICTKDGAHSTIYKSVHRIMLGLGYMRSNTYEVYEQDLKIKIIDYKIGVDS